ncbi:MAG: exodeoxyribonuclease VII small subunit [Gammaproteobacteria bacterium]|nr:MAG: exodeoxyribonuclease VII small subunit [Gammaproteobacteria bacterium]
MTDKRPENKSYETAVSELENILTQLESNDLPLEDAIKQFESGVALIKHCQGILDTTEQKIAVLTGGDNNSDIAEGFCTTELPADVPARDIPF